MIDIELLKVVEEAFPNAKGLMFTGSQLKKTDIDPCSDIDIVVFEKEASMISSLFVFSNGIRFDCTIIPLFDLENVMFNEQHDPRGVVFTMIAKGKIIKDPQGIVKIIQRKIRSIYHKKNAVVA